jgi:hypothetical protein
MHLLGLWMLARSLNGLGKLIQKLHDCDLNKIGVPKCMNLLVTLLSSMNRSLKNCFHVSHF